MAQVLSRFRYLKEFRTEQCPLFVQHKCTQHRPFTCFHWHFVNQRRRRPVRRRDGTFNYSHDIYCTKYDETTGICPEGDECPFLHRTTGDTERRYHLRYYKTGICIHETDSKGNCTKNGPHCAFAHGPHDLRSPVYDIRELQVMDALQNGQLGLEGSLEGQTAIAASHAMIEKTLIEEPRWQDSNYVLANYKTEQCKKPPRLCRQGYACPYYHNSKDQRRNPRKHKYRSSPCPSVKHGDEWGDPAKCEQGDSCQYCHTRTEQQFHPEVWTKAGTLPMSPITTTAVSDSLGGLPMDSPLTSSISSSMTSSLDEAPSSPLGACSIPGMNANALPFYPTSDTVESVIESALDDLDLNDFGVAALEKTFESHSVSQAGSIMLGGSLLQSSAPVNIPGSLGSSASFHSTSPSPPVTSLSSHFLSSSLQQHQGQLSQSENAFLGTSTSHGSLGLNGMNSSIWENFVPGSCSPSSSPAFLASSGSIELVRLRHELDEANGTIKRWEESWKQAKQACNSWKKEVEEANERIAATSMECKLARDQKDSMEQKVKKLQEELERIHTGLEPQLLSSYPDLEALSLTALYTIQKQLRTSLERVDKAVYQLQSVKCLKCQELNRIALSCQHAMLCEVCSTKEECPVCDTSRTLPS